MASLYGEVGTKSYLAKYCQQLPEVRAVSRQALSEDHSGFRWIQQLAKRSQPHSAYQELLIQSTDWTRYDTFDTKGKVYGQHTQQD